MKRTAIALGLGLTVACGSPSPTTPAAPAVNGDAMKFLRRSLVAWPEATSSARLALTDPETRRVATDERDTIRWGRRPGGVCGRSAAAGPGAARRERRCDEVPSPLARRLARSNVVGAARAHGSRDTTRRDV